MFVEHVGGGVPLHTRIAYFITTPALLFMWGVFALFRCDVSLRVAPRGQLADDVAQSLAEAEAVKTASYRLITSLETTILRVAKEAEATDGDLSPQTVERLTDLARGIVETRERFGMPPINIAADQE